MKGLAASVTASILLFTLAGCAAGSTRPVQDQAGLIASLRAAGAQGEQGEPISQPFFTPDGRSLQVDAADIQVFEYRDGQSMEAEASQVAADGASVGTTMVDWLAPPHFYKGGRILVLYLGDDKGILGLLMSVLGAQFAGQ